MMTRIEKCFLLGACGDALGAPIEGVRSLARIRELYGEGGLADIIEGQDFWEDEVGELPRGRVTDDTTMAMTTAAALVLACRETAPDDPAFAETMRRFLWQGYLAWGSCQAGGEGLAAKIDTNIEWPPLVRKFWFRCGAGRGTIAALMEDAPGSVAKPLAYKRTVRGREVSGPNPGCGGMMRVAPVAFLPGLSPERIFELGCESAAVTHGNQTAFVATGAVALFIHFAAKGEGWLAGARNVLASFSENPLYAQGVSQCLALMDTAEKRFAQTPHSLDAMDALPAEAGAKNAFLAGPVLAQVVYALLCGERGAKHALVVAANHSGDSDSVAAIVGNVLGAGDAEVPQEWADVIIQRPEILAMAEAVDGLNEKRQPVRPPSSSLEPVR